MSSPSSSSRCCFLFPWMCDFCHVFFYFSHDIGVYSHCFYFSEPTENRFTREIISHRCHLKVLYLFMVLECVFHSFKIGFLFGMFGSGLLNTVFPEGWGFFFLLTFWRLRHGLFVMFFICLFSCIYSTHPRLFWGVSKRLVLSPWVQNVITYTNAA